MAVRTNPDLPVPPQPSAQPSNTDKPNAALQLAYGNVNLDTSSGQLWRQQRGEVLLRRGIAVDNSAIFKGAPLYGRPVAPLLVKGNIDPTKSGIIQKGSLVIGISTVPFTAVGAGSVSGQMTITFSWPKTPIRRADGTSTQIMAGSLQVGNLLASTAYFFFPFWSDGFGDMGWVNGGTGNPAIAFTVQSDVQAQTQNSLDRHPLSAIGGLTFSTPAAGSSNSGTGGYGGSSGLTGCPARGTEIHCLGDNEGTIEYEQQEEWVYVSTDNGMKLMASPEHPVFKEYGGKTPLSQVTEEDSLITVEGVSRVRTIKRINHQGVKMKISLTTGHLYWAGGILSHNFKQKTVS